MDKFLFVVASTSAYLFDPLVLAVVGLIFAILDWEFPIGARSNTN